MTDYSKECVKDIARMVNSFSFNPADVCKGLTDEHRTLQQTFTSLCLEWIKLCGSDEYRYDGRNEIAHNVCKELIDGHDVHRLPLI